jgi:hypothetical protein
MVAHIAAVMAIGTLLVPFLLLMQVGAPPFLGRMAHIPINQQSNMDVSSVFAVVTCEVAEWAGVARRG